VEPGQQFGKYEIRDRLAKGGMAEVYVAVLRGAAGFEKRVALKRILPGLENISDFRDMFAREARLVARLSHANVVQVHDFDEVEGQGFYIAMELVEGCDLATLWRSALDRAQLLPVSLSVRVTLEVAAALVHAHELVDGDGRGLGLVHRDISPQNVLLSRDGAVKLTDFGIAKAFDAASVELFREADDLATLQAVRRKTVPPPSSINPAVSGALDAVVLRALNRDADARYQRAAELVEALEPLAGALAGARGRDAIGRAVRGEPEPDLQDAASFSDEPVRAATARAETRFEPPGGPAASTLRERPAGRAALPWLLLVAFGGAAAFGIYTLAVPDEPPLPATPARMMAAITEGPMAPRPQLQPPILEPPPELSPVRPAARVAKVPRPLTGQGAAGAPGDRVIPVVSDVEQPAAVPQPAVARAGKPAARGGKPATRAAKPVAMGVISINVVPWGSVWVDGKELRDAPIQGLELTPGIHRVRAEHPRLGRREKQIRVRQGDNGTLILRFDSD